MARKEKQYHFIYKTTNLLNGKYYYGMHSTDNLNDDYYGSGRRLKCSLNKYGKENHKVEQLEFFPDRKSLIDREKEIVNLNEIAKENCMNLMIGGKGGFISEEQQRYRSVCANKKLHEKRKCDNEFNKLWLKNLKRGIKKSIMDGTHTTWKDNYSWKGKKHKEETKKIMSIKASMRIKEKNSQYGTCWITNGILNKKIKKCNIANHVNSEWKLGRIV